MESWPEAKKAQPYGHLRLGAALFACFLAKYCI